MEEFPFFKNLFLAAENKRPLNPEYDSFSKDLDLLISESIKLFKSNPPTYIRELIKEALLRYMSEAKEKKYDELISLFMDKNLSQFIRADLMEILIWSARSPERIRKVLILEKEETNPIVLLSFEDTKEALYESYGIKIN